MIRTGPGPVSTIGAIISRPASWTSQPASGPLFVFRRTSLVKLRRGAPRRPAVGYSLAYAKGRLPPVALQQSRSNASSMMMETTPSRPPKAGPSSGREAADVAVPPPLSVRQAVPNPIPVRDIRVHAYTPTATSVVTTGFRAVCMEE